MTFSKDVIPRRVTTIAEESAFAERIEGQIEQRAGGRIRDLQVRFEEGRITLSGRSRTYHAKQLALQVVLDHLDGSTSLANQIVVC